MNQLISDLRNWSKKFLKKFRTIFYYGKSRWCPVCQKYSSKFRDHGLANRKDVSCIHCGALERDRFAWLYLSKKTNIFDSKNKKMLHIAPEMCFKERLKKHFGNNYLTADLFKPNVMEKMDITSINYSEESFDIIYCSHVLEHIEDDIKAMSELYRVLKQNGFALLMVPILREKTFEDYSIKNPKDRLKVFGQEDHVRIYGFDFIERLKSVGFEVKMIKPLDIVSQEETTLMGLTKASGEIFYCTK